MLQGRGGVNNVTSPLIAYVREGACYVTELPEVFNPSEISRGSKRASVDTTEIRKQYFIHDDFSLLVEVIFRTEYFISIYLSCRDQTNTTNCQARSNLNVLEKKYLE